MLVAVLMLVTVGILVYDNSQDNKEIIETDYMDLVYLKQAPNSYAREPRPEDIDTGVVGTVNGISVKLYASRTWANNDYGKTFLWVNN